MATWESGKAILLLVIYMIVVGFLSFVLVNTSIGDIQVSSIDLQEPTSIGDYVCSGARFNKEDIRLNPYSEWCGHLKVANENECISIEGCTWEISTKPVFLWWGGEVYEYCDGAVNSSYYHDGEISYLLGNSNTSLCDLSQASTNESLCSAFGCEKYERVELDTDFNSIYETLAFMFGFSVTFDAPPLLQIIISLLFVYLPLIALLLAIYFSLPVIH